MPSNPTLHLQTTITERETGLRLDQALAQLLPDYSRSQWKQWIKSGDIKVNNNTITQPKTKVKMADAIDIHVTLQAKVTWQAQALDINIVHEDEALLVINKPAGLVTHPGAGNPDQTLVNALLHHHPELEKLPRAGIVHRLDKDTTGLMVVAKTLQSHQHLVQAIQARELKRVYQAIALGTFVAGGTLDFP